MYCPSCGKAVAVKTTKCSNCEYDINEKLFSFEHEKTEKDLQKLDIKNNKLYALSSYFGPFVILSFLKSKESDFTKFHCNQGILLCMMYVLSGIIFLLPNIGMPLGFAMSFTSLSFSVMGMSNVFKKTKKELPIIGKYKILK